VWKDSNTGPRSWISTLGTVSISTEWSQIAQREQRRTKESIIRIVHDGAAELPLNSMNIPVGDGIRESVTGQYDPRENGRAA
jgi:hypothetical protein